MPASVGWSWSRMGFGLADELACHVTHMSSEVILLGWMRSERLGWVKACLGADRVSRFGMVCERDTGVAWLGLAWPGAPACLGRSFGWVFLAGIPACRVMEA